MPSEPPSMPLWLDLANERLWCGDQARALRPKTFALLRYLLAHPGQVLPKAALLEALWPETMVSEVVLAVCIRELRQVLGDDARAPRFIETVHRRGYRFLSQLPTVPPAASHLSSPAPLPRLAGRAREWDALHGALATALTGVRQLLFVTGEAGLGKTTLVEAFLTALEASGPLWIGRGQCLDHYGAGEAYLPVLEALGRLCRGPGGQEVIALLGQQAPAWLVQMPGLVPATDLEAVQRRSAGATQDRMLWELAEALERLTVRQPLLLVLEDLHWSDPSTLDVLAVLARRREPARLLLLGTYRVPDALQRGHPLETVHHELQRHGQCRELSLSLLSETAVATYLTTRFADAHLPAGLARLVYQRTEGNPLFMVTVVDDWVRRGWLVPANAGWTLQVELAALASTVPEDLLQLLEEQLERLNAMEQRVLEGGSVAGATFSAAAVAAGLAHELVAVEAWCAGLARRHQWLEACGEQRWPDGTVAGGYRFRHALYQEVAYQRLPAARRAQLHRRIGERVEAGYRLQARERATELAMHFTRGQDPQRAVRYLQYAGEQALQRAAYAEALQHLTQALALLATLPATPARHQHELALLLILAPAVDHVKGGASADFEHVFVQAYALCQELGDSPQLVTVLHGLRQVYNARGDFQRAREYGEQALALAQRLQDPAALIEAHYALGVPLYNLGEITLAHAHFERGISLADALAQPHRSRHGVLSRTYVAMILWYLGYPDQALRRCHEALTLAQSSHPFTLYSALRKSGQLHQLRREVHAAHEWFEAALALASEQGLARWLPISMHERGWALATQGQHDEGMAQMRQGIAALQATGTKMNLPYLLARLAEVSGNSGQAEEGLRPLAEALAVMDDTGGRRDEAWLYHIKGELLLQQALPDAAQAEACFQQALAVARRQQAKSWELRAAMSLARLWQRQSKRVEARELLAAIYGWFTEGFDTADLQEAKALLEALG
jgi:DNA-binding winged helix-turn-helix (wHTH) protein/predicted ATPase